jgi:hypothetical protein
MPQLQKYPVVGEGTRRKKRRIVLNKCPSLRIYLLQKSLSL